MHTLRPVLGFAYKQQQHIYRQYLPPRQESKYLADFVGKRVELHGLT